ncbi:hypothetical protein HK107_14395 [Parvularcula sp. ZS-1/3]|uniref:DoxX family membrane protein n=1 Tax=Parvularcula mediterranea TaxID=2732508 RepID=A0A7Y3RNT6_9PROT|nr:hypothetical protein [Parvularcula mediterranea]NNU17519.1 hypothetical protein [Parvularcula mediterranea]
MTTPLIIITILFGPTLVGAAIGAMVQRPHLYRLGAIIGLSAAFIFFAVGHFVMTEGMIEMLPPFVPHRLLLVYATGVLEATLGLALLVPAWRKRGAQLCILVLILFFPANVYAALNETGLGGHQWGPSYLLIRTPLQVLLIGWAYWFGVRETTSVRPHQRSVDGTN